MEPFLWCCLCKIEMEFPSTAHNYNQQPFKAFCLESVIAIVIGTHSINADLKKRAVFQRMESNDTSQRGITIFEDIESIRLTILCNEFLLHVEKIRCTVYTY